MIQTLALYTIQKKWSEAFIGSTELADFCQTNFGNPLKVFLGIDIHELPGETDCPFIIIGDAAKKEGEADPLVYSIPLSAAIFSEGKTENNGIIEYAGVKLISDFCQLIYAIIAEVSPNNPVTEFSLETNSTELFPMHVGSMDTSIEIPYVIGGSITY